MRTMTRNVINGDMALNHIFIYLFKRNNEQKKKYELSLGRETEAKKLSSKSV